MTSTSAIVTSAALIGYQLSADKALATLPLAMQFIAVMAVTVPASFLMKRIGRRDGFTIGLFIGLVGAGLAIVAIREADFILFCVACFFVGAFNGFGQYYRFAAADTAEDAFKSRAISLVMAGGVIASVGPLLANYSKDLLPGDVFAGVYLMIAILYIASLVTLRFVNIPRPSEEERQSGGRPMHRILRQPIFIVAALGGMVGYMLMSLLMASTPLAMHSAGAVLIVVCVAINLGGLNLTHFWIGGMALGVGWCFLFVGATTLVTECYSPAEKAKTQAANDFLVFASVACAALLSGVLHEMVGWQAMNYITLPFAAVAGLAVLYAFVAQGNISSATAGTIQAADPARMGTTMAVHSFIGFSGGFAAPFVFGLALDLAGGNAAPLAWVLAFASCGLACLLGALAVAVLDRPSPAVRA
mgnify:CR=1 FL=1